MKIKKTWQATGDASVPTLLAAMAQSDLWDVAEMDSVVTYLLDNRHLNLPPAFRNVLLQGLSCS